MADLKDQTAVYMRSINDKDRTPVRPMQDTIMEVMAMGYDPLSKKNSFTADYTDTVPSDTYDYIRPEQWDLSGLAIFITGGSKGYGRAFAAAYAKAGASYIGIGARSSLSEVEKEIQAAAKAAGRAPPQVLAVELDVTNKDSVALAAKETEKAFGRCDILINNAGYLEKSASITEVDPDDWWHCWTVNTFGMFLVTRAFMPLVLQSRQKTIVNLSSVWAFTKFPDASAYEMSKMATVRFSEIIQYEHNDKGLITFSYHPGNVDTALAQNLRADVKPFLTDTPVLGANTLLWLTAERREWLGGRFVSGKWDMEEFLTKKEKIIKEDHLKFRLAVGRD